MRKARSVSLCAFMYFCRWPWRLAYSCESFENRCSFVGNADPTRHPWTHCGARCWGSNWCSVDFLWAPCIRLVTAVKTAAQQWAVHGYLFTKFESVGVFSKGSGNNWVNNSALTVRWVHSLQRFRRQIGQYLLPDSFPHTRFRTPNTRVLPRVIMPIIT